MNTTRSILVFIFLIAFSVSCKVEDLQISSPDGTVTLSLFLCAEGSIHYYVTVQEGENPVDVIEDSPMGIRRRDAEFVSGLKPKSASKAELVQETYTMLTGSSSECSYTANQRIFEFENARGDLLQVQCRVFDDGVAFRYVFPGREAGSFEVTGETTGFNLPDLGRAWMQPYDVLTNWSPAYERSYTDGVDIGTPAPENSNGWCFPMLFQTGDYWVYISEAGLDTSYCGSHLEAEAPQGIYSIRFPEEGEAGNYFSQNPESSLPWKMPWRYIVVSHELNDIFTSSRVNDLSAPSVVEDDGWITPGIASWSWWFDGDSPKDYQTQKEYVDFTARMGWEYCLVDEGWHEMKEGELEQLVEYANSKGVGIFLWYDSGGRIGFVQEDWRKVMYDPETRTAEMKRIAGMGVRGIKVDFFQSDKQGMIKHYHRILEDAADHGLMVNFHGCTMPRGWSRTYPHLMTMEAVQGAESYHYVEDFPMRAPMNSTVLPLTRNVAGPMDYTPVTLSNMEYPRQTTVAHEMALPVIFTSGIQHLGDHYLMYESMPDAVRDYLKNIPASWDESILLAGYPGQYFVVARRKGEMWCVAGINGEPEEKIASFSFNFLSDTTYRYVLLTDGPGRNRVQTQRGLVDQDRSSDLVMNRFGGFASYLLPVEE